MGILHRICCAADSSTAGLFGRYDDLAPGMLGFLVADGSGDLIEPMSLGISPTHGLDQEVMPLPSQ